MKKELLPLLIAIITLASFSKKDDSVCTTKVTGSHLSLMTVGNHSGNIDTLIKGDRGNETPYRTSGKVSSVVAGRNGGAAPVTKSVGKGEIMPFRSSGHESHGGNSASDDHGGAAAPAASKVGKGEIMPYRSGGKEGNGGKVTSDGHDAKNPRLFPLPAAKKDH